MKKAKWHLLLFIFWAFAYWLGGLWWCLAAVASTLFGILAPRVSAMLCGGMIGAIIGFFVGFVIVLLIMVPFGEVSLFFTIIVMCKAPAIGTAITVFAYIVWGGCCITGATVGGAMAWDWTSNYSSD